MRRLRVLHLIGAAKPGGAETFALRLMAALHAHPAIEQQVLCRTGGWLAGQLKAQNIPHTTAPFASWWDAYTPFFTHAKAKQTAAQFKPDVVLAWMNRGVTFMPQGPWAKVARMGGFYNLKYYQQRVTDLIGNTPHITAYCREHGWPAAHVHMVGNFIPSPPTGWQAQRTAQRAAWGWLPTDVGLVVVGRLHANKGIETALHALATLPENFKLALVGSGPAEQELGRLVKSLGLTGRVVFTGWTNEVSRAASAADMWLVPSLHEPLGNTAIDAWVHSVPLIVSAVGGLDALVEEGMHGLKVPPNHAPALAAAITRLHTDKALQAKVVKHGTARWLAEHSESKIVSHYLSLFTKLAKLDKAAKSA